MSATSRRSEHVAFRLTVCTQRRCTLQGLAVASAQWGPWAGAGMAALSTGLAKRLTRLGLRLISPPTGLNALGAYLHTVDTALRNIVHAMFSRRGATHCAGAMLGACGLRRLQAVAAVDWQAALDARQRRLHFFSGLLLQRHAPSSYQPHGMCSEAQAASQPRIEARSAVTVWWCCACLPAARPLSSASSSAQAVLASLQYLVCDISSTTAATAPLTTASLDSLGALELRDAIATHFNVTLPATAAYDYPNLKAGWLVYRPLPTALQSAAPAEHNRGMSLH